MKGKWWHTLVKPSTIAFFLEGRRTEDYSLFDWLHGYVYARWPYLYIGIGTGEHWAAGVFYVVDRSLRWLRPGRRSSSRQAQGFSPDGQRRASGKRTRRITFADTYHGKVVPLEAARQLVTVGEEVHLRNLEKIIPYARARDLILKNPDHIIALECPCRSARDHPCLPLDVCLIVGEPFASFVAEHHPSRTRWITPGEAVEILRAEDERGHVHHAFFKDAMLGRFYAICNCCACCCGAMQIQRHGTPMLASSGYVAQLDEDLCIGCGECNEYCQFEALSLNEFHSVVNQEKCMGCGVCVSKCAQGALVLEREVSKGEPLEILELIESI